MQPWDVEMQRRTTAFQITVTHDLLVRLVMDKRIWGRRDATRRWPSREGA